MSTRSPGLLEYIGTCINFPVGSVAMRLASKIIAFGFGFLATGASAAVLEGPGRFCGYSPIIDLHPGEQITTLDNGIHGGSFEWKGGFGKLIVHGMGWASRPKGRISSQPTGDKPGLFSEQRRDGKYILAIWNGRQGAAYFESATRFTRRQRAAIDRVRLFQEGEKPKGCNLRTAFVWPTEE